MKRPTITAAQRLKVFEDHGAIVCCQEGDCDNAIYIKGCDIDHHLALIDGGKHEVGNLRPICTACHAKKSARGHIANCKAKRIAKACEAHAAVVAKVMERPAGSIRNRGFDKSLRRRFNGKVVPRV